MRALFRIGLTVSAMVVGVPAIAQVTTSFDGTYNKVSATPAASGSAQQNCPPAGAAQLTITGGIGRMQWPDGSVLSGWVDPHGMLTLQNQSGLHLDAQIENGGAIKATLKLPGCSYAMTWQKKP
jgi:hypothetical protein